MSSDLIKQMAARILSTIKNQYPSYYNDNSKKEYLVRYILSKIDSFSKHINIQTAPQIVNKIISEITQEFHTDRKLKENFNNMSTLSKVQFERNNMTNTRPNIVSQRPISSNKQESNNSFVPVQKQYEKFNNDYNLGVPVRMSDEYLPVENKYEQLLQARQRDTIVRNRPPTPDFSLDGSGKKKREEQQKHQQQHHQLQRQTSKPHIKNNNFTHNPQTEYGIIGSNELPQNNDGFSSFDNVDDNFSNINIMNTGINPSELQYDESVSVDTRLKQIQNDRSIIDSLLSQNNDKSSNDLYNLVDNKINEKPQNNKSHNNYKSNEQFNNEYNTQQHNIPQHNMPQYNIPQQQPIQQQPIQQSQNNIHIKKDDNQVVQQLLNQQKLFQEEINKLRTIIDKPKDENIDHIRDKLNELEEYKTINIKLQDRIVELQKQIQTNNDTKVLQLQKVKEETTSEIEKLKKIQEDIVLKNNENIIIETELKKIIKNNINSLENAEEIIYINKHYTELNYTIKNITSIEITDFDLPFNKYNITLNNNKLYFKLFNEYKEQDINNDSDTANIIDSDIDNLINLEFDNNELILIITMGNYTIENLLSLLNKQLNKYDINISISKTTNFISFKSKFKFDLLFEENTILPNLGFNLSNQFKYINSNRYSGTKPYDFRIDKVINIYTNINSKPIMQYKTNLNDLQSKKISFNPIISELNHLEFKFIDSKNKEFVFDSDNGLDFNIKLIIRYINNNYIKNNLLNDDISSDDIINIAKLSIKN